MKKIYIASPYRPCWYGLNFTTMNYKLLHGDCIEQMQTLPDNSVDSIVTDPPYGLGFMGKKWDKLPPGVNVFAECLRVLKPGGHMVAFGGSRTYHRMAVAVEDAGFEIRDQIMWVYSTGFPKSYNLKRANTCDCDGKSLPYDHKTTVNNNGLHNYGKAKKNTKYDLRPLRGTDIQKAISPKEKQGEVLHISVSEQDPQKFWQTRPKSETTRHTQPSMEGRNLHRAEKGLPDDSVSVSSESKAKRLCTRTPFSNGEDNRQTCKNRRGRTPHRRQQAEQSSEQFKAIQKPQATLDDGTLRGCGQCERCGKLKKEYEGFGSSLKPAHEPIVVARKPLSEPTIAANVLKWGTGGINVDGCRVEGKKRNAGYKVEGADVNGNSIFGNNKHVNIDTSLGRFPANLITDGSDEVLDLFPVTKNGGQGSATKPPDSATWNSSSCGFQGGKERSYAGDSGSAARFFYCAKASKRDRDEGCEGIKERESGKWNGGGIGERRKQAGQEKSRNHHPTVKPTDLMRYLCRLITPPGGTVLDPFTGSGSTGKAAALEGFSFIGCEIEQEYIDIARARIEHALNQNPDQKSLF